MSVRLETTCRRKIQHARIKIEEGNLVQKLLSYRQQSQESKLLVIEGSEDQMAVVYTPLMDLRAYYILMRRILNHIYKKRYHIQEQ